MTQGRGEVLRSSRWIGTLDRDTALIVADGMVRLSALAERAHRSAAFVEKQLAEMGVVPVSRSDLPGGKASGRWVTIEAATAYLCRYGESTRKRG